MRPKAAEAAIGQTRPKAAQACSRTDMSKGRKAAQAAVGQKRP
jgi:hypothetical protein